MVWFLALTTNISYTDLPNAYSVSRRQTHLRFLPSTNKYFIRRTNDWYRMEQRIVETHYKALTSLGVSHNEVKQA